MDSTDRKILAILQKKARMKKSEMAREVNIPATTLQERIRKLENSGLIKGYQAVLDSEKIGFSVQAFVSITLASHEATTINAFEKNIKTINNIKACYHVSGRFDYLLYVVAKDLEELGNLVKFGIASLPDFGRSETHLIFSEIESSGVWPVSDSNDS